MKKFLLIFVIVFFESLLLARSIELTIDKNVLTLGEQTILHVKVSGFSIKNVPEIKNLKNFEYQFIGTSSNITIINGKINSQKEYNFIIIPKKIGSFTIGPAIVKYKKEKIKSNTIKVIVKKTKFSQKNNKFIFIKLFTNKNKVKVNEEIILTLKIYRKIEVTNLTLSVPEFKKAIVEKLDKAKTYSKIINGQQYLITEIRYAIFPTIPGELEIEPFILRGEIIQDNFDAFFKNPFSFQLPVSKTFTIPSNSIKIKVDPLKENVYAVGDYIVNEKIDKTEAKIGENINLEVTIKGRGNLRLSNSIKLEDMEGLKFYYDKPEIKITKNFQGFFSEKIEKIAIIPEKVGKYVLPQIVLKFYNPTSGKYESIKLPKIILNILGNQNEKIKIYGNIGNRNKKVKNKDIIQCIYADFPLKDQSIKLNLRLLIITFAPGIIAIFIIVCIKIFIKRRKEKVEYIISKNAFKLFKKTLKDVNTYQDISKIFKEYFNNKFNLKKPGLTFEEILNLLKEKFPKNIYKEGKKVILILEQCLYASESYDIKNLKEILIKFLEQVESESKSKNKNYSN